MVWGLADLEATRRLKPKPRGKVETLVIITIAAKSKQISILQVAGEASARLNLELDPTYRLACSSFFGLPCRILNIQLAKPKKWNYSGDSEGHPEHFIKSKAKQPNKPEFETHNKILPKP